MNTLTILLISLLGSTHCAGMCGGFATFCGHSGKDSWTHHICYNCGRLLVYLSLGVLAGLIGASIDTLGILSGVAQLSTLVLGAMFIIFGVSKLWEGRLPWVDQTGRRIHSLLFAHYLANAAKVSRIGSASRPLLIGMLSALLPCGWLYSFVALAGATGTVSSSVLTMFIFWLGTLPMLLSIGRISQYFLRRWGVERARLTAALMIVAGLLAIAGHLGSPLTSGTQEKNKWICH